ncbi:unnamed protein product [Staurois parvus]|uniref:Uncharacterized protein n=1 Tax=Staurois parvus TaxID=386267 RepID=A0ABN9G214_9NEOB|nr:unnamed protein product [Staurois parvus]
MQFEDREELEDVTEEGAAATEGTSPQGQRKDRCSEWEQWDWYVVVVEYTGQSLGGAVGDAGRVPLEQRNDIASRLRLGVNKSVHVCSTG